nr:hypothetical protein [Escherichia coli]
MCDDSVFCLDGEGFALRLRLQQGNTVLVATLAYEVKR